MVAAGNTIRPGVARTRLAKHGVSFEEGSSVFGDPLTTTVRDTLHSLVPVM
jgi:uncharacterized DUF497 family protein